FRAAGNGRIGRPSPNLLDTLSLCGQRRAWYRDFARVQGDKPLAFVGSARLKSDIAATAAAMRSVLGLDLEERQKISAWDKTLRRLIDHADALGILVMVNGVVGNNSYRRLDPQEFRGFALADARAPLVFINGADAKAAQMFTLAHALAHIWLGQSALSDVTPIAAPEHEVERWCSAVAAEVLVPLSALRAEYRRGEELRNALTRLVRRFKVGTPIILRRIHDLRGLTEIELQQAYERELERLRPKRKSRGGDFYRTQGVRLGKRFARALVISTLEGETQHGDAFRLLSPVLTALATMGNVFDILELNNGELCVLRWLRISGGKATLSTNAVAGNSLFVVPAPLLKAGYVKTHTDPSSPKTVPYTLTAAGLEALEVNESKAFF